MALSHRDLALNQNVISIVDDTVENGIGDGAFTLMAWINTLVPSIGVVLRAKDNGAVRILSAATLHDFQKIVGLLSSQTANQPLINNQKV